MQYWLPNRNVTLPERVEWIAEYLDVDRHREADKKMWKTVKLCQKTQRMAIEAGVLPGDLVHVPPAEAGVDEQPIAKVDVLPLADVDEQPIAKVANAREKRRKKRPRAPTEDDDDA